MSDLLPQDLITPLGDERAKRTLEAWKESTKSTVKQFQIDLQRIYAVKRGGFSYFSQMVFQTIEHWLTALNKENIQLLMAIHRTLSIALNTRANIMDIYKSTYKPKNELQLDWSQRYIAVHTIITVLAAQMNRAYGDPTKDYLSIQRIWENYELLVLKGKILNEQEDNKDTDMEEEESKNPIPDIKANGGPLTSSIQNLIADLNQILIRQKTPDQNMKTIGQGFNKVLEESQKLIKNQTILMTRALEERKRYMELKKATENWISEEDRLQVYEENENLKTILGYFLPYHIYDDLNLDWTNINVIEIIDYSRARILEIPIIYRWLDGYIWTRNPVAQGHDQIIIHYSLPPGKFYFNKDVWYDTKNMKEITRAEGTEILSLSNMSNPLPDWQEIWQLITVINNNCVALSTLQTNKWIANQLLNLLRLLNSVGHSAGWRLEFMTKLLQARKETGLTQEGTQLDELLEYSGTTKRLKKDPF